MKLAILGGSFNPVHIGHLDLARRTIEDFGYDTVSFVPAYNPPHKTLAAGATDEDRCAMLSLALAGCRSYTIETCELERKGTSYTIDTVKYLYDKYSNSLTGKIGLVIGADLIEGFHLWKNVNELVSITDVLLAFRSGVSESQNFDFSFKYTKMKNALLDISSQEIRDSIIACGSDWEKHVAKEVYEYIHEKKLYTAN